MYNVGYLAAQEEKQIAIPVSMPSGDYGVSVTNATVVANWTWVRVCVVGDPSASRFVVRVYNDASSPVSNVYFRWVAIC